MPSSSTRTFPHEVAVFSPLFVFTTLTAKEVLAHKSLPYGHPHSGKPCSLFSLDDELRYTSFASDHGPLNLAFTFLACIKIHEKLERARDRRKPVCLYTTTEPKTKSNMILIAALYSLIVDKQPPWNAYRPIAHLEVMPFRDAGSGAMDYGLSSQDVLYGIEKAISFGLLDLASFDPDEYQYYETVENGDLNVLGPFIPFASPQEPAWISVTRSAKPSTPTSRPRLTPSKSNAISHTFCCVLEVFERQNVGLVVRLNDELYDSRHFKELGMKHVEMYFDDGTNPPDDIVREFIRLAEDTIEQKGKRVAVHCKAGLGRTGVLIGAYLIYKYQFTAQEAIGFMRIVRPGMVVGPQQQYMVLNQMKWAGWAARDQVLRELEATNQPINVLATPPTETVPIDLEPVPIRPSLSRSSTKLRVKQVQIDAAPHHGGGDAVGQPRKGRGPVQSEEVDMDVQEVDELASTPAGEKDLVPATPEQAKENEYNASSVSSLTGSIRGTKRSARGSSGYQERKPLPRVSGEPSSPGRPQTLTRASSNASINSEGSVELERPPKRRTASNLGSPLAREHAASRDSSPVAAERKVLRESNSQPMLVDKVENQESGRKAMDEKERVDTPETPVRLTMGRRLRKRVISSSPSPAPPSLSITPPDSLDEHGPATPTSNEAESNITLGELPSATSSLRKTMPPKRSFLPKRNAASSPAPVASTPRSKPSIGNTLATKSANTNTAITDHLKTSTPKKQGKEARKGITPPRITEMWGQLSRMGSSPTGDKADKERSREQERERQRVRTERS
ncbi:cell division cycle 14 [Cryptococcus wingfieldii CBS 7118]|uniref:protein-tyrosine-phosphatase n=1 Tax=Cryptococcus wingfieldii CBS 7118 TaxID=1295528 RepID=A0A1E3IPU8_9TREE|nr:cell division cycle 14 [Cryptococcus wingfieldii CBS 7118]ODN89731.1 cell division cycle 14 [Cryptococcus wingfieldii CBS 7118]